jgi:hypothetical protein
VFDKKYVQQNNISNIHGRTIDKPTRTCLFSLSATEMTHHHFQGEHIFYTIHTTRVESEMSIQHMLLLFPLLFILIRTVKWGSKIQCEMITNQSLSRVCREQNELIKVSAKNHKVLAIMWLRITAYIVISHQVIQQWIDTPLSYLCAITKLNNAIPFSCGKFSPLLLPPPLVRDTKHVLYSTIALHQIAFIYNRLFLVTPNVTTISCTARLSKYLVSFTWIIIKWDA